MMTRRDFVDLTLSSAAFTWLDIHALLAEQPAYRSVQKRNDPLISSLALLTACDLEKMKRFYASQLGLRILTHTAQSLSIQAGKTIITFNKSDNGRPFYHFAFNIPENKIDKAYLWQKSRTPIIHPNPLGAHDQVVTFAHWNAHSIFFLDPAGNLLEFIARHDLKNSSAGPFTTDDILYVSEIGFIVDDVKSTGNELKKVLRIESYRDASPGFWPIGDEYGLLLMIEKGKIWSAPVGEVNKTDIYETSVKIFPLTAGWRSGQYPYHVS